MVAHLATALALGTVGEVLQQYVEAGTVHTHRIDDACVDTEVTLGSRTEHETAVSLGCQSLQGVILGLLYLALLVLCLAVDIFRLGTAIEEFLNSGWRVGQTAAGQLVAEAHVAVARHVGPCAELTDGAATHLEVYQRERATLVPIGLSKIQVPLGLAVLGNGHLEVQCNVEFAG